MTDPNDPQPQPVKNANSWAATATLIVGAALACLVAFGVITPDDQNNLGATLSTAATAIVGAVSAILAAYHAHRRVTPIARPRDADGHTLAPIGEPRTEMNALGFQKFAADGVADTLAEQWDRDFREWKAGRAPSGIHAHPTRKLGKLPPIPGRKAVPFGQFLTAAPEHPLVDAAPRLDYPMDHNDGAGCCVVAALDHALQAICALLGVQRPNWTDDELLAFYRTQNPDFRSWADGGSSADRGMVIQTFLEYLVAQGVILAFGKIDHTNEDELKAAVYLGLAVVTGEELDVAQQSQSVWDYKRSADWGGHATCTVGYQDSPDRQTVVTWGELVDVTQAFIAHQLDEAWFVLTQAHVDHPGFREHFDLAGFAAAVAGLTDGKVVVPVPAPQPPAPEPPAPAPGPAPAALPADVTAWAGQVVTERWRSKKDRTIAQELLDLAGGAR